MGRPLCCHPRTRRRPAHPRLGLRLWLGPPLPIPRPQPRSGSPCQTPPPRHVVHIFPPLGLGHGQRQLSCRVPHALWHRSHEAFALLVTSRASCEASESELLTNEASSPQWICGSWTS